MAEQQAVECEQGSEVAGADEVEVFAEAVAAAAATQLLQLLQPLPPFHRQLLYCCAPCAPACVGNAAGAC